MPKRKSDDPLQKKLDEIRRRLIGNPTHEELQAMQLQMDVMLRWVRLADDGDHHHDHMDDHDHTSKFIEPFVINERT